MFRLNDVDVVNDPRDVKRDIVNNFKQTSGNIKLVTLNPAISIRHFIFIYEKVIR